VAPHDYKYFLVTLLVVLLKRPRVGFMEQAGPNSVGDFFLLPAGEEPAVSTVDDGSLFYGRNSSRFRGAFMRW